MPLFKSITAPSATAALLSSALLVACAPNREAVTDWQPFPAADGLLAADQAFARASSERGAQAWAEVWAEAGMLYRSGDPAAIGPDEARTAMAGIAERLCRQPAASAMLWPDALGYTTGHWWRSSDAAADAGRYLTIWQRADAGWKIALDVLLPARYDTDAAHDFDFWLGDWTLEQRIWTGEGDTFEPYAAHNRVRGIDAGGALIEAFEGDVRFFWAAMEQPARIRGASVRVYDPLEAQWRIFWIDTLDRKFGPPFTGAFAGGTGVFLKRDPARAMPPTRIRFMPRPEGTVGWDLSIRTQEVWQPLWMIEFRRR